MSRGLQVGDTAPDFTLPSQSGQPVRLHERLGHGPVVLYFYPKDESKSALIAQGSQVQILPPLPRKMQVRGLSGSPDGAFGCPERVHCARTVCAQLAVEITETLIRPLPGETVETRQQDSD